MPSELERLLPLLSPLSDATRTPSLDELARIDGRSPSHLQRVFRSTIGESPLQFARRVRLQRAALALIETRLPILEVALDAGFDSHEGFSRAFKGLFGCSPRQLRRESRQESRRATPGRSESRTVPSGPFAQIAPCVGLYRAPLNRQAHPNTSLTEENRMPYEVAKKTVPANRFVHQRRDVAPDELPQAFAEMFGAVYQFVLSNGLEFAGRPTARYPKFGPGLITVEAGMAVAGDVGDAEGFQVGSIGGGTVAATEHYGPYDSLGEAHQAVERWIAERGEEVGGFPCEIYVTDPGDEPDPAKWLTEIQWPLSG